MRGRKVAAIATQVAIAAILSACSTATTPDDARREALERVVVTRVADQLVSLGLPTAVLDADCAAVPPDPQRVDVACHVRVDGTASRIPVTATATEDDEGVDAEVRIDALVVTQLQGVAAVQPLLDRIVDGVTVRSCALPDAINVLGASARFTCDTDSLLLVTLTVTDDLTLDVTGTRTTPRK